MQKRGDDSLTALHHQYDAWFFERLRRRFGPEEADDLRQETWLRVATSESTFAIRHPKAFLLRVATNISRSRNRRATVAASHVSLANPSFSQAEQVDQLALREIVLGLPEPLRDVFVLSRFGGLTNSEIAEHLGIRPKTVEWRMTRALAHCAAQLRL